MARQSLRKTLSMPGLLKTLRQAFEAIPDPKPNTSIPLADHLMSGVAVFGLKFPSLLQFDEGRADPRIAHNLQTLYGVERAPCDTYLRERLDQLDPGWLRGAYRKVFAALQRGKGLEPYTVFGDHYLLSIDGTGQHSSGTVQCDQCCQRHHRDGRITYYHQLLAGVLVHPTHREVFPLMPEPIVQQDGQTKNDCERNAAKRLLQALRKDHPNLKLVVVEDALASNGPHIRQLKALNMRYILGAKAADHAFLYDWVETSEHTQTAQFEQDGIVHRFRYHSDVPLNDANFDLAVNFIEYWEETPNGKPRHFAWVTDLPTEPDQLMALMRAGRARWRIENETFNTLKTQGYGFEHNYGHGKQHLATVLSHLMMLAFLVDQLAQRCCSLFQAAREKVSARIVLWERQRGLFREWLIADWQTLYYGILGKVQAMPLVPDTS